MPYRYVVCAALGETTLTRHVCDLHAAQEHRTALQRNGWSVHLEPEIEEEARDAKPGKTQCDGPRGR